MQPNSSSCRWMARQMLLLAFFAVVAVEAGRRLYIEDYGGQSDQDAGLLLFRPTYSEFYRDASPPPLSSSLSQRSLPPHAGASSNASLAEWSRRNTRAWNAALSDARPGDVVVLRDGYSYTFTGGVVGRNLTLVTVDFAGTARFVHDRQVWPLDPHTGRYQAAWRCEFCVNVTMTSTSLQRAQVVVDYETKEVYLKQEEDGSGVHLGGVLDGDGAPWWDEYVFTTALRSRPRLMELHACRNVVVEYLTLINSPYWTLTVEATGAEIHHVNVLVNRKYQRSLKTMAAALQAAANEEEEEELSSLGRFLRGGESSFLHTDTPRLRYKFPDLLPKWVLQPLDLNTDGIDILGVNVSVHDCVVYNDDDSVAVKPLHNGSTLHHCTQDIVVQNMVLTGFGASVGSVGPVVHHNCVNRITFRNITMPGTGKGIYIKDSGSDCNAGESSQISNILYEDIHIIEPFWWSIWIGPQAIQEPGDGSPGCCKLAYPVEGPCPTQACATFENITIRNVRVDDPVVSPGVILGNASNPMRNIVLDNVTVHIPTHHVWYRGRLPFYENHFPYRGAYHCVHVTGTCIDCHPAPPCLTKMERSEWIQRQEAEGEA